MKNLIYFFFIVFLSIDANCSTLPLRSEISLNGEWQFTPESGKQSIINVPDFWDAVPEFSDVRHAIYERKVVIPKSDNWENKTLKLEFEAVNFIAEVYINQKHVYSHTGGWMPFSVDISKYVKAGETFSLKVDVKGGCYEPIIDKSGAPQWPVGFVGQENRWGIIFDVWLRSYGKTHIEDAAIITSFRDKTISVAYVIKNNESKEKNISILGEIIPATVMDHAEMQIQTEQLTIHPGETKTVIVHTKWEKPHLWSPADPFLYYLHSSVTDEDGKVLDTEYRRFGFREVWAEGNKLIFNGHRFTILGTNIVQHSEFHKDQRYIYMSPESWNSSIDRLFELNLRTVRFHMQPAPKYILDIADERGLLVIEESPIYAREYILNANKEIYLENCKKWIEPWIISRRNHPSIIIWNAENEMGVGWLKWMTPDEMLGLGNEIRRFDTTRLVNYDGDGDVGDRLINYHYPEGYAKSVEGSIYSWADSVSLVKPTGVGEFITHYGNEGEKNQWSQGNWVRGMRYNNFADIRPYRHDWAWLRDDNTDKIKKLGNAFAPVALFDKEYDDLGIEPLLYQYYPVVYTGDTLKRTLVLYNDEFSDSIITIEVLIKSSEYNQVVYNYNGDKTPKQKIIAQGSKTYFVSLGEHIEIPYSFQVPAMKEGFIDYIDVELITRKKGNVKFRETFRFEINNKKKIFRGSTSKEVTFGN